MDKAEAVRQVKALASSEAEFAGFAVRAEELLNKPDGISQGPFGVCSMTSIVRTLLLQDDLTRFVELLRVVFTGGSFNNIAAPRDALLAGRRKQFAEKDKHRAATGGSRPNPKIELDFILARSLGKLLKIKSPLAYDAALQESEWMVANFATRPDEPSEVELFELDPALAADLDVATVTPALGKALADNDFRAWFHYGFEIDPAHLTIEVQTPGREWRLKLDGQHLPDYKDRTLVARQDTGRLAVLYAPYGDFGAFQKQGDLGVGGNGLHSLMTDVIGAAAYDYWPNVSDPMRVIERVNPTFAAGPSAYVYAFVHSGLTWGQALRGNGSAFDAGPREYRRYVGKPPVTGTHVVVLTGPITDDGTHVQIPTWTWGGRFTAHIPKDHLKGFIGAYAYGRI